jgi:CMP-N,N'-diacetyllegionaminic acid synthase
MTPNPNPTKPSIIALIPARAGSKRVKGKNIRTLAGHPLIAYTIAASLESGIFDAVIVSTDSPDIAEIAQYYGAEVPFLRPAAYAADQSPDIEWIDYTLKQLHQQGRPCTSFSILRPTSPFRQAHTIQRAWQLLQSQPDADSLRAVEKCAQHPGKMWIIEGSRMRPLLSDGPKNPPWHSTPYQALPIVHVQNASLEMAWTRVVLETGTIAGESIIPFVTEAQEGFDINTPEDWWHAEYLLNQGQAQLPSVPQPTMMHEANLAAINS